MKKWLMIGAGTALFLTVVFLLAGSTFKILSAFGLVYGGLAATITALGTNFGHGYSHEAGWSHSRQRPWTIPAVERPRLGGFATGFSFVALLDFIFIVVKTTGGGS
jgi:hypothetical protein